MRKYSASQQRPNVGTKTYRETIGDLTCECFLQRSTYCNPQLRCPLQMTTANNRITGIACAWHMLIDTVCQTRFFGELGSRNPRRWSYAKMGSPYPHPPCRPLAPTPPCVTTRNQKCNVLHHELWINDTCEETPNKIYVQSVRCNFAVSLGSLGLGI